MKINVVFCSIIFFANVVGVAPYILTDQNAQNLVYEISTLYENNIQSYSHFKNAYFDNLTVNFT